MQDRFPIDDHFRDRLGRSEVAPPPAVWEAVEAELARKRRRLVGFWLTGGWLGQAFGGVWLAYSPGKAGGFNRADRTPSPRPAWRERETSSLKKTGRDFGRSLGFDD